MALSMETIVDTRQLYRQNPEAFEQAAENLKKIGIPVVSKAVDRAIQIAKSSEGMV